MKYNIKPFAIAATFAATFAALAADPAPRSSDYLVAGFENYAAGTAIPGQTVEDVCAWTSTDPDGATVVAHASAPAMPNDVTPPKPFVDFGDNYLDVDSPAEVACTLSTPTTSPESTFIDAMVQFNLASPNEDPTTDVSDAKFMMWMRNDGDSTNLYVKGSRFTWRDEEGATNDTLEFSDAIFRLQPSGYESIAPGTWHRVTITHFNNIFNGGDLSIGGFTIAIDGCSVSLYDESGDNPAFSQDAWDNYLRDNLATDIHDSSKNCANLMANNALIPSLPTQESGIRGLAFKGTGAVDDIVVTSAKPTFNEFTLRWPQDATGVSYSYTRQGEDGYPDAVVTEHLDEFSYGDGMVTLERFVQGTSATLTATLGYRTFTISTNNVQAGGVLTLPDVQGIARYFPQTDTPDQDGSAGHPFEIATALDLEILADAVANAPDSRSLCYRQVAHIDFAGESPFFGVGTYADNPTNGIPFTGVYDGGEHTISNVTMTARRYGGIFNQVNGGTLKDLTVVNIYAPANAGGEYGYAIVGNAGNGATLANLTAEGSFCTSNKPGTHNMAGIVVRASGGSSETLVEECRNYATIYGNYTKIGGICAITQTKVAGGNPVRFERCWNGGDIVSSRTSTGVTGHGGIVGYVSDHTVLNDCGCDLHADIVNASGANTNCDGLLVGQAYNMSLTDTGNNHAPATGKMVGTYGSACTVTNFQFATLVGDWDSSGGDEVHFETAWTTQPPLNAGGNYLLERNVTAADSPVFTFPDANGTISFGIALGYAIDPAALASEYGEIVSTTNGNWVTFSIRQSSSYPDYIDGEDAVVVAAYEDWAETYGTDDNSEFEKQFLLNVAPETALVGNALEITAIDLKANGTLDLTVGCSSIRGGLQGTVDGKSYRVNNGYLAVVYAASLADLATAPASTNAPLTAAGNGEVTVNVNAAGAKFFKAKLSTAKEPVGAQNND